MIIETTAEYPLRLKAAQIYIRDIETREPLIEPVWYRGILNITGLGLNNVVTVTLEKGSSLKFPITRGKEFYAVSTDPSKEHPL